MSLRSLAELTETDDPAWPAIAQMIAAATNEVTVLPVDRAAAEQALLELQVTLRSALGAIVFETGGLIVDHGWLRVLGSGHPDLPRAPATWSRGKFPPGEEALLVADDAVGGFFAIAGSGASAGRVRYLAPDTLAWESLDIGHADFVQWACSGDLTDFYADLRWPSWRDNVAALRGDQAFSIYPFPWAKGPPLAERSRRPVPIAEIFALHTDFARELGDG